MTDYLASEFGDLEDWIKELDALNLPELDENDDNYDDKTRVIELITGWTELVDEIGYEPTIAYRHN